MKMYEPPNEGELEEIKIELTKSCPLACIHCSSNGFIGNYIQLNRDTVLSLIAQAADMHVKSIVLSGGEPLLWPWIEDAVSECKLRGLNSVLYTTGMNQSGDGAKEVLKLATLGLGKVIFSLYSASKNKHEEITRKLGSFNNTLEAIQGLRNKNIIREIHFVPLKLNYRDLRELTVLAKDLGIPRVSILRFVPQGRGVVLKKGNAILMRRETAELKRLILDCKKQNDIEIRLGSPYNILLFNDEVDCIAARKTLCIAPNGNLYPCDAFKNTEPSEIGLNDSYGSINQHSLAECWKRSKYLNAIRRYLTTPFEEPCLHCSYLGKCKSGCLAQKVIEQESIEKGNIAKKPDPLCLKNLMGDEDA